MISITSLTRPDDSKDYDIRGNGESFFKSSLRKFSSRKFLKNEKLFSTKEFKSDYGNGEMNEFSMNYFIQFCIFIWSLSSPFLESDEIYLLKLCFKFVFYLNCVKVSWIYNDVYIFLARSLTRNFKNFHLKISDGWITKDS